MTLKFVSKSSDFLKFQCFVGKFWTFAVGKDKGLELNRKIFDFGSLLYRYHDTSVARPTQVGLYCSITTGVEEVGMGGAAPPI